MLERLQVLAGALLGQVAAAQCQPVVVGDHGDLLDGLVNAGVGAQLVRYEQTVLLVGLDESHQVVEVVARPPQHLGVHAGGRVLEAVGRQSGVGHGVEEDALAGARHEVERQSFGAACLVQRGGRLAHTAQLLIERAGQVVGQAEPPPLVEAECLAVAEQPDEPNSAL